jgi:hypothetical protein
MYHAVIALPAEVGKMSVGEWAVPGSGPVSTSNGELYSEVSGARAVAEDTVGTRALSTPGRASYGFAT